MQSLEDLCIQSLALKALEETKPGLIRILNDTDYVHSDSNVPYNMCKSITTIEASKLPFDLGFKFLHTVVKHQWNRYCIHYIKYWFFHGLIEQDDATTLKYYFDNHLDYFSRLWHMMYMQLAGENQKLNILEFFLQEMKKEKKDQRLELYDYVLKEIIGLARPRRHYQTVNLVLKYFPKTRLYNNYSVSALEAVRCNNLHVLKKIIRGPGLFYFYSIELVCELVKEGKAKEYKQLLIWCWRKFNKDLANFNRYCSRKITYLPLKDGETYTIFFSNLEKKKR
jgi:hypothetical protein